MTDRHVHCVYYQYNDPNTPKGFCILKQEEIDFEFNPHCPDIVLRPMSLLSYFLQHEGYCGDWKCADKKALEYLGRIGFNTYPKIQKNDGGDVE